MKIEWKDDQTVPGFCGVEPDVTINLNRIVIACRDKGIRSKMGTINDDHSICWVGASCELPCEGDNRWSASPSIALNSHDTIVEIHHMRSLRGSITSYCCGQVIEDSILWGKRISHNSNFGEYPCISLSDDGTIFEVHRTGTELLHRKGGPGQFTVHHNYSNNSPNPQHACARVKVTVNIT